MASMNRVNLVGNITRDIELRYTSGGTAVCDIGLAVNERVKKGEEWVDEPVFLDVTVWGKKAEIVQTYCSKGSQIGIDGKLRMDSWEAQDGSKRTKLKVQADDIVLLGQRSGGAPQSDRAPQQGRGRQSAPANADDIPF